MQLLISMGLKPSGDPREPLDGALRVLDTRSGEVTTWLSHRPAHHLTAEHAELTGSRLLSRTLLQCTRTSVVAIDLDRRSCDTILDHPLLYDVHDIQPLPDGRLAVAATGHDSVLLFRDGVLDAHAWLHPEVSWGAPPAGFTEFYNGNLDFRREPFDRWKPHRVHPNHLTLLPDGLWVTGLEDHLFRRIWPTTGPAVPLPGPPHDGLVHQGRVWLTTVDGQIVVVDPARAAIVDQFDLPTIDPTPGLSGWCRGLCIVGERLFVGMTTLRASAHRERLRELWRGAPGRKRPTRVVEIDLRTRRKVAEWPVGNDAGGTIYAIHSL